MRTRIEIDWKILLLVVVAMLLIVQALRGGVTEALMDISYQTLHYSRLGNVDTSVLGEPTIWHTPIDRIIRVFDSPTSLLLISILSSILSAWLFYLLLGVLGIEGKQNAALLWIISPITLHMAYVGDGTGIAVAGQLFGLYAILRGEKLWSGLALAAFLVSSYHSPWHGIVTLSMLLVIGYYKPGLRPHLIGVGFGLLILGIILQFERFVLWWPLPQYNLRSYGSWISDLGGYGGIGVFTIFLGFFGMLRKQKRWIVPTCLFILLSYVDRSVLPYALCLLAWSGGNAVSRLQKRKWATKDLKWITLLLIVCGVMFSPLSYGRQLQEIMPNENLMMILDEIEGLDDAIVFTSPDLGAFVEERGQMIVIPQQYVGVGAFERVNSTNEVFHSYDLSLVLERFEEWNVTHVLVTPQMTSGGVWEERDKGLHYLLHDGHFKNVYRKEGYGLWEVYI